MIKDKDLYPTLFKRIKNYIFITVGLRKTSAIVGLASLFLSVFCSWLRGEYVWDINPNTQPLLWFLLDYSSEFFMALLILCCVVNLYSKK